MMAEKRVLYQIVREFTPQAIISLIWASYRVWPFSGGWIPIFITNFSGAFFLTSWLVGQIYRISRQQTVEDKLEKIVGANVQQARHIADLETTLKRFAYGAHLLQIRSESEPALAPAIEDLSALAITANDKLSEVLQSNAEVSDTLRPPPMRIAAAFALVGVTSILIDISIFSVAYTALKLTLVSSNLLAWWTAVSTSYVMNALYTFGEASGRKLRWRHYGFFMAGGSVNLIVQTTALVFLSYLVPVLLAKLSAILVSFAVNMTLSRAWPRIVKLWKRPNSA